MLLPGRDQWSQRMRDVFIEGYEQFRGFDIATLSLIEPLRGMRVVHYSAWLGRRWHDPIFPRTWPHFNTPDYWQQETQQLEDIASHIKRNAPDDTAETGQSFRTYKKGEDPSELTNADYFFDWEE